MNESAEKWRYEKIIWENEKNVKSEQEAKARYDSSSNRPEISLTECYQMALYRSENLRVGGEELVRLQAQYEEVLASILPSVNFKSTYSRQEKIAAPGASSVSKTFVNPEKTEDKFTLHQPIFSGFKEFYGLSSTNLNYTSSEARLRHARLMLFYDVAQAFYIVLQVSRELETLLNSQKLAKDRLNELTERQKLGISRKSEVLAQDADVARIQSQIEAQKGSLDTSWNVLQFLTGMTDRKTLLDEFPVPGDVGKVEDLVSRANELREDLKSARAQVESAESSIGVARAGHYPTVGLDTNYYTHRAPGFSENINWDLLVTFDLPLFQGGKVAAQVREAYSAVRAAQLQLDRTRRQISLDINRAYADVKSLQSQILALESEVKNAQENYDLVVAEYSQKIVTNIEVQTAFDNLQRAILERDRDLFQLKLAGIRLQTNSGLLPGVTK